MNDLKNPFGCLIFPVQLLFPCGRIFASSAFSYRDAVVDHRHLDGLLHQPTTPFFIFQESVFYLSGPFQITFKPNLFGSIALRDDFHQASFRAYVRVQLLAWLLIQLKSEALLFRSSLYLTILDLIIFFSARDQVLIFHQEFCFLKGPDWTALLATRCRLTLPTLDH